MHRVGNEPRYVRSGRSTLFEPSPGKRRRDEAGVAGGARPVAMESAVAARFHVGA